MNRRPPPLVLRAWLPLALAALALAPPVAADSTEPARQQAPALPAAQPPQPAMQADDLASGLSRRIATLGPLPGRLTADAERALAAVLPQPPRNPAKLPAPLLDGLAATAATAAATATTATTATATDSPSMPPAPAAPAAPELASDLQPAEPAEPAAPAAAATAAAAAATATATASIDLPELVAAAPLPEPSPVLPVLPLPPLLPLPSAPPALVALVAAKPSPEPSPVLPVPPLLVAAVPLPEPSPVLPAPTPASLNERATAGAVMTLAALAPTPAAPVLLLAAASSRAPAPAALPEPRFDLSINNAPAAQVFLQLANGTAYNMLVSPDVSGTLSITLKDTTVPEAMDTMREMFGFEYRITGNRIFVYPNTVQTRLYRVNYLPGRRQGASDTRITSSAITASANAGGSGGGGGSGNNSGGAGNNQAGNGMASRSDDNAHVRTTHDTDFWREVQSSLITLVGTHGGRSVVLNPGAGVVVVKATPAELRQVENYLKAVQLSIERQVMLEAKIVEVSLSKDSQTGINWAGFGKLGNGLASIGTAAPGTRLGVTGAISSSDGNSAAPGVDLTAGTLGRGFYGLAFQAANFAALLNFLQTQGEVQVLSSPRIATLNNQKAVLKVGSDELYVTGVSTSTTSNGNNSVSSPTLTLQPFFSGISLDVTPQIDDVGNVMLHVHPTISTVSEKNKNIDLGALGSFRLPLAASTVNETDSIVRVRDGQIVAIGGLMKTELHDERTGMPGLSDLPGVGGLFRQTTKLQSKRELVIMIKPSVIHEDGAWPDAPSFGAAQSRSPSPGQASDAAAPLARR